MQFTIKIPKRCKFDLVDDFGKVATITCPEEDYEGISEGAVKSGFRIENLRPEEES